MRWSRTCAAGHYEIAAGIAARHRLQAAFD
jgi:hypothetical protein